MRSIVVNVFHLIDRISKDLGGTKRSVYHKLIRRGTEAFWQKQKLTFSQTKNEHASAQNIKNLFVRQKETGGGGGEKYEVEKFSFSKIK